MNIENIKNSKAFYYIQALVDKINDNDLAQKSAALTYYFLLCVGPFMMLLLYLAVSFLQTNPEFIAATLGQFVQEPELIIDPIMDYLNNMEGGSVAIISILVTLFSASKASRFLVESMESIFGISQDGDIKDTILDFVFAYIFTGIFLISIVLFLAMIVYGDPISIVVDFLFGINLNNYRLWTVLSSVLPIVYLFLMIFLLFKGVSMRDDRFKLSNKHIALGSIVTALGWVVASLGYSIYVSNFNTNNVVYGTLGNFMVLMLWFYLLIFILLIATALISIGDEPTKKRMLHTV